MRPGEKDSTYRTSAGRGGSGIRTVTWFWSVFRAAAIHTSHASPGTCPGKGQGTSCPQSPVLGQPWAGPSTDGVDSLGDSA